MKRTHLARTRTRLVVSNVAALCRAPAARPVASIRATRAKPAPTSVVIGTPVREAIPDSRTEMPVTPLSRRYDEHFLKWIPLVVPMFAVMLAVGAYSILGMVL